MISEAMEDQDFWFKDEPLAVDSYSYPDGYKVRAVAEQVATLKSAFLELQDATYDERITRRPLPANAEGWFAIPRWERIGTNYSKAVEEILLIFDLREPFHNYREGLMGPKYMRQHTKTVMAFQRLGEEQSGHDILVVPCQFGLRHRGRSIHQARAEMDATEFGLGIFAVGSMMLTHPEREVRWDQLHIDCAGDEFSQGGSYVFAPCFYYCRDAIHLMAVKCDTQSLRRPCGSASGFLS